MYILEMDHEKKYLINCYGYHRMKTRSYRRISIMKSRHVSRNDLLREIDDLKKRNRELEAQAAKTPEKNHAIKVELVNPFLEAVLKVLKTMCQIEAKPKKAFLKQDMVARGDVTGIVSISNEQTNGTISVTFPELLARTAIGNMIGEDIPGLSEDVHDGVGELTNQISGQARQGLAEKDIHLKAGIPSIVMGHNHEIRHIAKSPVLAIPFSTRFGELLVEVCLECKFHELQEPKNPSDNSE